MHHMQMIIHPHLVKDRDENKEASKLSKISQTGRNYYIYYFKNLFLTQQYGGAEHRPAYSQAKRIHILWLQLQVLAQRCSLHPHLEAHLASSHTVGESAARPQRRELSIVPRLPTRTVRSHLKVEVTVICTNKEGLRFKTKLERCEE